MLGISQLIKVLRLRKPGMVFLVYRQNLENDMLKFVLVLPAASAFDVVSRELSIQVGNELSMKTIDVSKNETEELSGQEGDTVSGSLIDIDNAGNRSEPRDFEFTLVDTLAPPMPGELGLRLTGEEADPDVAPEPEPLPTE